MVVRGTSPLTLGGRKRKITIRRNGDGPAQGGKYESGELLAPA